MASWSHKRTKLKFKLETIAYISLTWQIRKWSLREEHVLSSITELVCAKNKHGVEYPVDKDNALVPWSLTATALPTTHGIHTAVRLISGTEPVATLCRTLRCLLSPSNHPHGQYCPSSLASSAVWVVMGRTDLVDPCISSAAIHCHRHGGPSIMFAEWTYNLINPLPFSS